MNTFAVFSGDVRLGGWIPVTGEGEQIAALVKAFGNVEIPSLESGKD